jgi:hypothetical protein
LSVALLCGIAAVLVVSCSTAALPLCTIFHSDLSRICFSVAALPLYIAWQVLLALLCTHLAQ